MAPHQDSSLTPPTEVLSVVFQHGTSLRSRSVGPRVLVGLLDIPAPPPKVVADWEREIEEQLGLEPGDVETLPLARTRMRWPGVKLCIEAADQWAQAQGLADALAESAPTLMACRGARYHHDAVQYGGAAFCNLFLSEDQGLDLHFPALQLRIPLQRGLVVLFDTGQPHAVIPGDRTAFDPTDFPPQRDCSQVFLTWEIPMDNASITQALGIVLDLGTETAPTSHAQSPEAQLWHRGAAAQVCPRSGALKPA
jgi:hypothetical protein